MQVYTELAKCWAFEPSRRPDFDELKAFFEDASGQVGAAGQDHRQPAFAQARDHPVEKER